MVTLECLLQEQSVLLLADDISVLSPVAESLVGKGVGVSISLTFYVSSLMNLCTHTFPLRPAVPI
jgi:hypothetical protein